MKHWTLLLVLFATPVGSPLACGGDGCLRNSDCSADQICNAGQCVLENPARGGGEGGAGGDDATPVTAGATSTAGRGGAPQAGSGGKPATDGGETSAAGQANEGGAGAGGAGGDGSTPSNEGGLGGTLDGSLGGAP